MPAGRGRLRAASLLLAAGFLGGACGGADSPASGTGGRDGSTAVERPLEPVVLPDLAQVSDSVRQQIESRWQPVDSIQAGGGSLPRARRRPTARSAWC